jgi:hypothetical protein
MSPNDNYNILIAKLQEFTRKYYINQVLRGCIYFVALLLLSYLFVALLEGFGRFGTAARTGLFYTFIGLNLVILGRYIVVPLLKLFNLGSTLTNEEAAEIIGRHFSEVKDKLLNTLQLKAQATLQPSYKDLIEASISQKIIELKPVPFVSAVDFRKNRKYLKYALIPLGILLIMLVQAPHMLLDSTVRLVKHNKYFVEKAPFSFILENDTLTGIRQEDYVIKMKVKGKELPAEMFILVDGIGFKMNPISKTEFTYTLKNLQKELEFQFNANGYNSQPYTLKVLPKPFLQKFEVRLQYPGYLGKKDDILSNAGDLSIPQGTKVKWSFYTENTENISLLFKDKQVQAERKGENLYTYQATFLKDDQYYLRIKNNYLQSHDSIQYSVSVIPDAYPAISVQQEQDSMSLKNLYFTGTITDDYGFTRLLFNYHYTKSEDSSKLRKPEVRQSIAIAGDKTLQSFYHFWDMNQLDIKPGDEIEYYFEVWDNDGVNGAKSSRSEKLFFKAPSIKELDKQAETSNASVQSKMESAVRQASALQKDMQDARMKLMNKKQFDWQDKKMIEDVLKKQENLKNTVNDLQKEYNENLQKQEAFRQQDEQLLEKQKALQEMFDKIMDPETKKLMEDLKKMVEENMKDEVQKQLEEMKFQDKEVQKELDRMQELFKQFAFQQKLQENMDKLNEMAKEQDQLAKESENNKADSKELAKKQDSLNKKFEDFKKDMQALEQKNQELEQKTPMEDTKQAQEDIQKDQQEGKQSLAQNQKSKASKSQKSAAKKMKEMAEKMAEAKDKAEIEQEGEDMQALRQILTNLLYLSFSQEKLMAELKTKPDYSPRYIELGQQQRKLKDDAKMIEDSLHALSKRVIQIKSFINREIGQINLNMDRTVADFAARNTSIALSHQQYVMTSVNNLAVMLSEVLKQMQQKEQEQKESKSDKPGSKSCKKPGKKPGGKPKPGQGMSSLRKMQEELNKQLQAMKKEGQKPGQQGKPGSGQGQGQQMSKELARMAAKQEAIRRELQRLNDAKEKGTGAGKQVNELNELQKQMDKTETDIVNKNITDLTIKRQQDIVTRMLESEKAEKQQDFDDKRESKSADQRANASPPSLEKYKAMKEKEVELLRTVPPGLNAYYRKKVKAYFEGVR